jgi:hypothetical protein
MVRKTACRQKPKIPARGRPVKDSAVAYYGGPPPGRFPRARPLSFVIQSLTNPRRRDVRSGLASGERVGKGRGMDPDGQGIIPSDFRVRTRTYPHGRRREVDSVVPLHGKVRDFLAARAHEIQFEIYDYLSYPIVQFGAPGVVTRKVYVVTYRRFNEFNIGEGTIMVFDQHTGDLLYHGGDGGE